MESYVKGFVKSYGDYPKTNNLLEFDEYNVLDSYLDFIKNKELEVIQNFKFHNLGLSSFEKKSEQLVLEYQVAFEIESNNKIKQHKGTVRLVTLYKNNKVFRCTNCGGSINSKLNICEYCDSQIHINSNKRWAFSSFKYN